MNAKALYFIILSSLATPLSSSAAYYRGDRLYFQKPVISMAQLLDSDTGRPNKLRPPVRIKIPKNLVGKVLSSRKYAELNFYTLLIQVRDDEAICGKAGDLLSFAVEAPYEDLNEDHYFKQMERRKSDLEMMKAINPQFDASYFEDKTTYPLNEFLEVGPDSNLSLKNLLLRICTDTAQVAERKKMDPQQLLQSLVPTDPRQKATTDYSALVEIHQQISDLEIQAGVKTAGQYQNFLKSKDVANKEGLRRVRERIRALIETSVIESPRAEHSALFRQTFSGPLFQQLVLEEIAYRYSLIQNLKSPESGQMTQYCETLIRALRLLQYGDEDLAPLGFEEEDSVLLLYKLFYGARAKGGACWAELTYAYSLGSNGDVLPYGLPRMVSPYSISYKKLNPPWLPVRFKDVYETEWSVHFPGIDRLLVENNSQSASEKDKIKTRFYWENHGKNSSYFKDSLELIEAWSRRTGG